MGWWKNDVLCGNSRKFYKNEGGHLELEYEGWFEFSEKRKTFNSQNDISISDFKKDSEEYKYWEMKDEYFLKDQYHLNLK